MQTRNWKAFLYFQFDTLQIHKKKSDENLTLIIIYNFELAEEFEGLKLKQRNLYSWHIWRYTTITVKY